MFKMHDYIGHAWVVGLHLAFSTLHVQGKLLYYDKVVVVSYECTKHTSLNNYCLSYNTHCIMFIHKTEDCTNI